MPSQKNPPGDKIRHIKLPSHLQPDILPKVLSVQIPANLFLLPGSNSLELLRQLQSVQIHMVSLNLRKVQISSLHDRIAHALQIVFYILYLHLNSFG